MRQKKKLLMAALLAVAVSTQGFAQPEALSEDELEEVSAQGLQIVENHNATFEEHGPINSQNNKLDSVQVNDGAMSGAITGYGAVLANSAVNSTANYLYDTLTPPEEVPEDKSFSNYFEQTNDQTAKNHVNKADPQGTPDDEVKEKYAEAANINKESQRIGTGVEEGYDLLIRNQDNNNNSVQLNESAQREASGMVLINAAASAVNAGENFFYAGSVSDTEGSQINSQWAYNFKNEAIGTNGEARAYNGEYEKGPKTQIVSNAGLALSHPETLINKKITIADQDNNNNSVQLNENAQRKASYVTIKNIAKSAANNGLNAVYIADGLSNSYISQMNNQTAGNHNNTATLTEESLYGDAFAFNDNKQSQLIDNASTVEDGFAGTAVILDQDNNNNSVQLNNQAQREAKAMIIENAATSAVNKGINLVGTAEVSSSSIDQSNIQNAANFNNYADGVDTAAAGNYETDEAQYIINELADVEKQENNNNSVQINDTAQREATGLMINNVANSAENVGINVLSGGDIITYDLKRSGNFNGGLHQLNSQTAVNHRNKAYSTTDEGMFIGAYAENVNKERQVIENNNRYIDEDKEPVLLTIADQDNNNNSVQLNNQAQYKAKAGVLSNTSMSGSNIGMNIMAVGDIVDSNVNQFNIQYAENFNNTADGGIVGSAVNMEEGATQDIDNNNEFTDIISQDNNNNSVQLNNNAQRYANAFVIENVANSAKNTAINGMQTGAITGTEVEDGENIITTVHQVNTQTAVNHMNSASGKGARAENWNKETQVIRNFTVDDPRSLAYIEDQDNNNNSVQLNNNAQRETVTGIMENVSLSASNTALNLLSTGDVNVPIKEPNPEKYGNVTLSSILQSNKQMAINFTNSATGDDNALAVNRESTDGVFYRTEEPEAGQMIENIHGNIPVGAEQNNNNNSVQLNDNAQRDAASIIVSNIANSATNIAVNMMTTGDITDTYITQENTQEAYNHMNMATGDMYAFAGNLNKQKQYIYNCNCTAVDGEQNNNMNSVQLNDAAQANLQTLVLLNSANSAANVGVNVLHAGTVSGSSIVQQNTATAVNFSNTANSKVEARAINAENYGLIRYLPW
ncbi:MAG TPA: hypothetical protein DEP48_04365 [Persephonella sp.]|uniref:Uncharacterized protein n=1 Tax=Persephonella marina (strain DSM 14350 / EX-H1) TaxID=123214 RepID=C0QQ77_PERMH|nr:MULTISPECIES: hypothetical protein [Persephonella]ACO04689.1 hypothetical protein PERMA_1037 [Persephonella marina EX-H1]HCB69570.1 hypothetical protein [Persephonella sp.]